MTDALRIGTGSLPFLTYINDIVENMSNHIRLFSDDTSLYAMMMIIILFLGH